MSDIYYDTYNEGELPEEKSKFSAVMGIVWKAAAVTVILFIFALLFYRMWEMKEPGDTGAFLWDEKIYMAYEDTKDGTLEVLSPYNDDDLYTYERENLTTVTLTKKAEDRADWETVSLPLPEYYKGNTFRVFTANTGSYTATDSEGKETTVRLTGFYESAGSPVDRALRVSDSYFIPAANRVQLTFRYKTDVLEKLNGKTGIDGSVFHYTLQDQKGVSYEADIRQTAKRGVYRYVTMVFDGVDLSDVSELNLIFEYVTEKDTTQPLSICIYDDQLPAPVSELPTQKPSSSDLSFLKED